MSDQVFVLGILLLTVVFPLVIILNFITKWKKTRELTSSDESMIEEVWQIAQQMENRVMALETILDAESPDWRHKQ